MEKKTGGGVERSNQPETTRRGGVETMWTKEAHAAIPPRARWIDVDP